MQLPKGTKDQPKDIQVRGQTITVPPNCFLMGNIYATQVHPELWADATVWRPSRWVTAKAVNSGPDGPIETIVTPARNTFFAWSDGPQSCVGMKFSQVEFVAVLACLFQRHDVQAVKKPGETDRQMEMRIQAVVDDSNAIPLLKMLHSERAKLGLRAL